MKSIPAKQSECSVAMIARLNEIVVDPAGGLQLSNVKQSTRIKEMPVKTHAGSPVGMVRQESSIPGLTLDACHLVCSRIAAVKHQNNQRTNKQQKLF